MTPNDLIAIILAASIPLGMLVVLVSRVSSSKGIGVRAIQFVAIATIIPGTLLLAIMGLLEGEAVAATFGATVGYLLGSIAKFDDRGDPQG